MGHSNVQVEWEINPQIGDQPDHQIKHIPDGLGSSLSLPNNRRPMVGRGSKDAHQLPGVIGCHPGSQVICQKLIPVFHPTEDQQHHSGGIHESPGRYNLLGSNQVDKEPVDVVSGKKYPHHNTTSPRVTELHY